MSLVPGIDLYLMTKLGKYTIDLMVGLGFPLDYVLLDVAIALGDYFGLDIEIGYVVDNRHMYDLIYS